MKVRSNFRKCFAVLLVALLVGVFANSANAQLPQDVRDVFEGMLDQLDSDLKTKFLDAISRDTATVEFTPDQFRRFRDNPVNPFEGLDQIDASDNGGNIALKFELPSMRDRTIRPYERQHPSMLDKLSGHCSSACASTVRVFSNERQVALGCIVASDGLILTKASEVENRKNINCELADGQKFSATVVRTDSVNDLAILKVPAKNLPVIRWSNSQSVTGAFVMTPDLNGKVLTLGAYSVPPRSTAEGEQAFLGVQPETTPRGTRIRDIRPGTASYEAGLRDGDVITKLDDVAITSVESLVKSIRDRRPGDRVQINYLRNGALAETTAVLSGRDVSGEQAAKFKMMSRLGAVPSRRDDNFPSVFQHDSPLFPEQCGGPITDLDGNVIGMNIARQGRAASYAIPSSHIKTLLTDLLRDNVASR